MEYVEGIRFDDSCESHRLTVPRRLDLSRKICGAIQENPRNLILLDHSSEKDYSLAAIQKSF
jgi:hypothetical protein